MTHIEIDDGALGVKVHGFQAPGTEPPGVITAGTFYERDGRVFWDVHRAFGADLRRPKTGRATRTRRTAYA